MLTKRQLEDARRCNKYCTKCNMMSSRIVYHSCIDLLAQTALAYRKMLERLYDKAESMFNYIEDNEDGYDPGTYDPSELDEINEILDEVEKMLIESEVEHDGSEIMGNA
jgi:hypothetical protein